MTAERLSTPEQLREFCRTGVELAHTAIDGGDPEETRTVCERVIGIRVGMLGIYTSWAAASMRYLAEEHGLEPLADVLDVEAWVTYAHRGEFSLEQAQLAGALLRGGSADACGQIADLVAAGDRVEAKREWDVVEAATLASHDFRREWVSSIWSSIYRAHGPEGLNALLLRIGDEPTWTELLQKVADADLVEQVKTWAFLLCVGNFGVGSITETDYGFVFYYNLCGSCGRQELAGRYEEPWCLARIEEPVPTLNGGDTRKTVYRAHQTVLHDVVPTRVLGYPWPVIDCQGPGGPGGCGMRFYRDPVEIPAEVFERAGLEKQTLAR